MHKYLALALLAIMPLQAIEDVNPETAGPYPSTTDGPFPSTTTQKTKRLRRIECSLVPHYLCSREVATRLGHRHMKRATKSVRKKNRTRYSNGSSYNWCGYATFTNLARPASNAVTYVSATWNVPTINASTNPNNDVVAWVGIDGWASGTVEQLGTEHYWDTSSHRQGNDAWIEMYPAPWQVINGFPVRPGDTIRAFIQYQTGKAKPYLLYMANLTAGVWYSTSVSQSTPALRNSAEWIVEAPETVGGTLLPLATFSPITFNNCQATLNGKTGSINYSTWQNEQLTMVTERPPYAVKARPSAFTQNGTHFSVSYVSTGP